MRLEAVEVQRGPWPYKWVIPADWWLHAVKEYRWADLGPITVRGLLRMKDIHPSPHYWPLRIVNRKGRVLWMSKAAKQLEPRP